MPPFNAIRYIPLASKEKVILMDDDVDLPLFSFDIRSTSARPSLSCSQRRNYSRHNHLFLERQAQQIVTSTPMNEDIPSPMVYPLPMKNQFYVLMDSYGEEDTHQIAMYSPQLVIWESPSVHHCSTTTRFRLILRRLGQDSDCSGM